MDKIVNIYVFDNKTALYAANTAENKNQIFFYDGQKLTNEPKNCIHVPIDNFIGYFSSSSYAYPQELNFDNMNFSDEIIHQIIENLTNALAIVKEAKLKEINEIIFQEYTELNAEDILYTLLQHIKVNSFIYKTIPFEIVYKLLEIISYIHGNNLPLSQQCLILAQELYENLKETKNDFCLTHLKYGLSIVNNINYKTEYFKFLANYTNIDQLINDFALIKILYTEENLQEYIQRLGASLFQEFFWEKEILEQKYEVFKLYYITAMNYGRGSVYKEIFNILYKVFTTALQKELDELVFYLYTPLMMSFNGVAQTQEEFKYFNNVVEKPLESFIKDTLISKYKIKENKRTINKNKKIKVAFLQERMINYSIYKVFHLLIKSLQEYNSDKYEFIIYDLNFKEFGGSNIQTVNDLRKLGITYIDLHKEYVGNNNEFYSIINKTLQIRRKIIKDKIDILIGMHSRPEYNFLFTTRTSPKQIYWTHGNFEYNIQGIDKKITHSGALSNPEQYEVFHMPIELEDYNHPVNLKNLQDIRALYPQESFILGSIGRLIKLDNREYIKAIATIMKEHPNTIYLACGDGDNTSIKVMIKEFGIENRFYFTGRVDANLYGNIIDLYLSPFPFSGGSALQEYMYKGKPYIIQTPLFQKNVDIYKTYDIIASLQETQHPFVDKKLYTINDIETLKTKGYLFEANRYFQTYSGLPYVKDTADYIKMADLLITNPAVAEKIGKETVYKAKMNVQRRGAHTFLELFQ